MIIPAFVLALLLSSAHAAELPPRARADVHFLSGFDYFRAGRVEDARREWKACRELDEAHEFCEFGLSVLDAGALKAAEAAPVTEAMPEREANQAYLEGVIYFQKGDYEKARLAWRKAKDLAKPGGDAANDASAGLDKIAKLYGDTPVTGDKAPKTLRNALEKKDEHAALEVYFTGLIHYQKGDMAKARIEWTRSLSLAPKDSSVEFDSKAALEKLDKDEAGARGGSKKM